MVSNMSSDMVSIPKHEYEELKMRAEIDIDLLKQFMDSFKDIKKGNVRRVK